MHHAHIHMNKYNFLSMTLITISHMVLRSKFMIIAIARPLKKIIFLTKLLFLRRDCKGTCMRTGYPLTGLASLDISYNCIV